MKSFLTTNGYGCRHLYQKRNLSLGLLLFLIANGAQANDLGNEFSRNRIEHLKGEYSALSDAQLELGGRVVNKQGQGIAGVTVKVKGGTLSTSTDQEGRFRINVTANTMLTLTAVGYREKEIAAPANGELQVTLESSVQGLEEVVVVGYGTQKRRLYRAQLPQ